MSGTLQIVFHGIIAIVRDGDRFHAIIPDTLRGSWDGTDLKEEKAADGSDLARHVPRFSAFPRRRLNGVRIVIDGLPGGPGRIAPDPPRSLPQMKRVVGPELAGLDPYYAAVLSGSAPTPPGNNDPPRVLACLTMDRGSLSGNLAACGELLALDGASDASDTHGLIATTAEWAVEGVTGTIEVRLQPLGSGQPAGPSKTFTYPQDFPNGVASLGLTNECREPGHGHPHREEEADDPDFRWYYRMLAERGQVRTLVQESSTKKLPYPRQVGVRMLWFRYEPPSGIVGVNCRPALFE